MTATEETPILTSRSTGGHHDDDHDAASHHHHHHHGVSSRPLHETVPIYAAPKQRQRWDDKQMLPHVNWGDLYFDLFYVAAAYQLSHAFKDSPTLEGLLYFVATYLPVFLIWNDKLAFDARFAPDDNLFHRTTEVLHLCALGLVVSCIQPAKHMKNTATNPAMPWFTGGYFVITVLSCFVYQDLIRNAVGGPEAKSNAKIEFVRKVIAAILYGIAFGIATIDYKSHLLATGDHEEQEEDGTEEYANYWPAYLMIIGYLFEFILYPQILTAYLIPRYWKISHKEVLVPLNIEYTIHRIGEWVMLMLGESVLSILTIPQKEFLAPNQNSVSYGINFFCGILTVTMFQYLFFRTQPAEAKDHALRRSQMGEMLHQAIEEEVEYDIKKRIALVYAISQTVSFVSLDLITISHRGFKVNFGRFRPRRDRNGNTRCAKIPMIVLSINLLLTILTLTLSMVHDLTRLSLYGCGLVFCQVMLRTFGLRHFPITIAQMERAMHTSTEDDDYSTIIDEVTDDRPWPNVTVPVSSGIVTTKNVAS